MRPVVTAFVSVLFPCITSLLLADDNKHETSDRSLVTKFLKEHIIDKTFATPKTSNRLDDNRMESESEDLTTFGNFIVSAQGFGFDMTTVTKETRYDLDKDGKRKLPGRDLSGTEVYRFEILERVSTKKLTGTARILIKTNSKTPSREGSAMLITGMKVADGKLYWNETLPGYLDLVAAEGKYKPCSWDGKTTCSLVGGKSKIESEYTVFDVDPDTLKRTPRNEKIRNC